VAAELINSRRLSLSVGDIPGSEKLGLEIKQNQGFKKGSVGNLHQRARHLQSPRPIHLLGGIENAEKSSG